MTTSTSNLQVEDINNKYCYFGEFGFFNAYVLGFLERINICIEIVTLYDYAKIIENQFPGKFKLFYTKSLLSDYRICFGLQDIPSDLLDNLDFYDLKNEKVPLKFILIYKFTVVYYLSVII